MGVTEPDTTMPSHEATLAAANTVRALVLGAETTAARNPYHPRTARARRAQLERQERELQTAGATIDPKPWERQAGAPFSGELP
jgi:hypothetical protein